MEIKLNSIKSRDITRPEIDDIKARLRNLEVKEVVISATGILASVFDAKGDLLAGTSDNNYDNLAVGTDGQVLMANSAQTTGLQWVSITGVTGFNEAAQDAVGTILTDSSTVDFTYDDAANTITAIVINNSISNSKLAQMTQATVKGRASGAGTGDPTDLSATQLNVIVGSSDLFFPSNKVYINVSSDEGQGQFGTPFLKVKGSVSLFYRESADTQGVNLELLKRRSGTGTILSSGDQIGSIGFTGADGNTNGATAARIIVEVDGTPGSIDMPGRIRFLTSPDGSATPAESFRVDASQNIIVANGKRIETDEIRARDASGLTLSENSGLGLVIADTTGNITASDNIYLAIDEVRARDIGGLNLKDDSGTLGIFIKDGGFVGIGSSNPLALLQIEGAQEAIRIVGTGGAGAANIGYLTFHDGTNRKGYIGDASAGNQDIYIQSDSGALRLRANAVDGIYIESGKLGVNNNSPSVTLDVAGNAIIGDGSVGANLSINGAAATSRDILYKTNGVNRWIIRCTGTAETGSNAGSDFSFNSRQDDGSALATPMTITRSNSNIGIRNATPQAVLHVGGGTDAPSASNVTLYVTNAGATALSVRDSTNNVEAKVFANTSTVVIGSVTNHALLIAVNDSEIARFDTSGNFGIGVTPSSILNIKAGTSTDFAAVGGVIDVNTTQTGNVGTGEDDLVTFSIPANTLSTNGQSIKFEAWGTLASNTNAKIIRARFGTTGTNLMFTSPTYNTAVAGKWYIQGTIIRTGATTQKSGVSCTTNMTVDTDITTTLNQTLSGAVTLKITGEGVSNNDIVIEMFKVKWEDNNS